MATLTNTVNDLNLTTAIGGAVPGAGDSVYISYYNLTYNAGTDLSTNAVALCHLGAGFTGSFTQGSPLKIKATTGSFVNEKGGTAPVYLISVNNATVIQTLVHGPKQGTLLDVNTCAVTAEAVRQARQAIRKALRSQGFRSSTRVVDGVVHVWSDDAYDALDPAEIRTAAEAGAELLFEGYSSRTRASGSEIRCARSSSQMTSGLAM